MATKETVQELINQIDPGGEYTADEMRALLTDLISLIPDSFHAGSYLGSGGGAPADPPPVELSTSAYYIDTTNGVIYKWGSGIWAVIFTFTSGGISFRFSFTPEPEQTEFELPASLPEDTDAVVLLNGVAQKIGVDYSVSETVLTWLNGEGVTLDENDTLVIFKH